MASVKYEYFDDFKRKLNEEDTFYKFSVTVCYIRNE